jgi:serine/threonine protein phosphatase 1
MEDGCKNASDGRKMTEALRGGASNGLRVRVRAICQVARRAVKTRKRALRRFVSRAADAGFLILGAVATRGAAAPAAAARIGAGRALALLLIRWRVLGRTLLRRCARARCTPALTPRVTPGVTWAHAAPIFAQLRTLVNGGAMRAAVAGIEESGVHYPPAPEGFTVYCIGDIHGRLDLLLDMQRRIDEDKARSLSGHTAEIYLGDYIDRGPDSAGVVSRLIERARETRAVFLRGNHEQMLLSFLEGDDESLEQWRAVGGTATLRSYGVETSLLTRPIAPAEVRHNFNANLPPEHRSFYDLTGAYIRAGAYLAVHGGIRPGVKLEEQKAADLLGIRQDFLQYDGDFGFIVVHGHTPVALPDLRRNRINIDTGAFATSRLTCLRIGSDGVSVLGAGAKGRPE